MSEGREGIKRKTQGSKEKPGTEKKDERKDEIKIGFININGLTLSTLIELEEEGEEQDLEIISIVETKLRNRSIWEGKYYRVETKGREKKKKKGGGWQL